MSYVTRPRANFFFFPGVDLIWDDDPDTSETITVHEPEEDGFTGLFNAKGEPLFREREPIGFDITRAHALKQKT